MNFEFTDKPAAPQLSEDAAAKLLQNVFDACEQQPNTIPLPKLASYSEYRRERYGVQKFLLIAVLLIFLALPMCFVAPEFTVERSATAAAPIYEIRVENSFPISQVAASVDGKGLVVSEIDDHVYSVTPAENGVMKVIVRLANRQYNVVELNVTDVDTVAPVLISNDMMGGKLNLHVEDADSGIDYAGVKAVDTATGKEYLPETAEDGLLVFDLPDGSSNVYVPDRSGNTLLLVISILPSDGE